MSIHDSREGCSLAKFRTKTVMFLLIAICLLSVALRYPLVEHERLNDTYILNILGSSIQDNHRALWTFSPLSYFGYYPASYPSGVPFVLAEISDLTGLPINHIILFFDAFIGILLVLGVFMLARVFIRPPEYAVLAAFFLCVAPRLVDSSYWSASARTPFVALAIVTIFLAFRAGFTRRISLYGLFAVSFVGCIAIHHMGVLFVLFGLAYLLSVVGAFVTSKIRINMTNKNHAGRIAGVYLTAIGATVTLIPIFLTGYFIRDLNYTFGETSLFGIKPDWLSMILRIAASYTNQIGFILPFSIVGIPFLLAKSKVTVETLFILVLPITFIPILSNAQYSSILLSPFIAILAAAVSWSLLKSRCSRRKLLAITLCVLIGSSLVLPFWSTARWNNSTDLSKDPVEVDNQFFNDGAYLRQYDGSAFMISNVDLMSLRLSAISGTLSLGTGAEATLIGDINASAVKGNLTWADEGFPRNLYSWFESQQAPSVQLYVLSLVVAGVSYVDLSRDRVPSGSLYYDSHPRIIVAVDNNWPSNFVWMWGNFDAKLPSQLKNAEWTDDNSESHVQSLSSYMIYQSERTSLYILEIPR